MTRMTGLIILVLSGVFSVPALACKTGPNYTFAVTESNAPTCIEIEQGNSHELFSIFLNNLCAEPVVVEPFDCVECDGPTEIPVGGTQEVVVEATKSDGTRNVAWLSGEDSGFLTLELKYYDTSNVCDDYDEDTFFGCQQGGSGNSLIGFLFILGWIGTRRLLASET